MKPDIRWQVLLSVVGLAIILGLVSYQVQSAALCSVTVPAAGGALTVGAVGRPASINPLFSDYYPIDRELVNLVYDGLVTEATDGTFAPALADSWSYSDDGLTLDVTLRDDAVWQDGQPVTAADVVFTYSLLQDEALPIDESLRALWRAVTIVQVDDLTVRFTLSQPYAPLLGALTRGILPAHVLQGVAAADMSSADFNRRPVGSGPFLIEPAQDWERSGRIDLLPNPYYWREGTQLSTLNYRFFPTEEAMLEAYRSGEVQALIGPSSELLPELIDTEGARLFTSHETRYSSLLFNLGETAAAAMRQKEVRQAMAYALDREALVDTALRGQGVVFEGPYLPESVAFRPGLLTSYTHQPETAAALLDAAGWTLPPGGTTRQQSDKPLLLRLAALDTTQNRAVAAALVASWNAAGISVQPTFLADVAALEQTLDEGSFDLALIDVIPPADPDLYDFWSQEAIVRGRNYGAWNNRRASEALEMGRRTVNLAERLSYYESFVRQFDADLPALSLFRHVELFALSDAVQEAEVGRFRQPRDRYATFSEWFTSYRDVTVMCPPEG